MFTSFILFFLSSLQAAHTTLDVKIEVRPWKVLNLTLSEKSVEILVSQNSVPIFEEMEWEEKPVDQWTVYQAEIAIYPKSKFKVEINSLRGLVNPLLYTCEIELPQNLVNQTFVSECHKGLVTFRASAPKSVPALCAREIDFPTDIMACMRNAKSVNTLRKKIASCEEKFGAKHMQNIDRDLCIADYASN